ncbi:hypothetical protein ACHAPT_008863 [Fusarium lateritium]
MAKETSDSSPNGSESKKGSKKGSKEYPTDTPTFVSDTTKFLNRAWGHEAWIPPATIPRRNDKGDPLPRDKAWTPGELAMLKDVTIAAMSRDIPLTPLYEPGGAVFEVASAADTPRWSVNIAIEARRVIRQSAKPRRTKKEIFDDVMAEKTDSEPEAKLAVPSDGRHSYYHQRTCFMGPHSPTPENDPGRSDEARSSEEREKSRCPARARADTHVEALGLWAQSREIASREEEKLRRFMEMALMEEEKRRRDAEEEPVNDFAHRVATLRRIADRVRESRGTTGRVL